MKVSSTYLSQSFGFRGADSSARVSKCSMNMFAMMGDRGDPMAAPLVCW